MDDDQVRTNLDAEANRLTAALRAVDRERAEAQAEPSMDSLADESLLEREVEESLHTALQAELADIEDARHRLADGTYGRCHACGDAIAEDRLAAVPATRYCVGHEYQAEVMVEARYVDDAPSPIGAVDAAGLEASHNFDLVPDDEHVAGVVEGLPDDHKRAGPEDQAIHVIGS